MTRPSTLLCLALLSPAPALSQAVSGRTVDSVTGEAVAEVNILVRDSTGALVRQATAGEDGRFELRLQSPGSYEVRAFRIGYDSAVVRDLGVRERETTSIEIPMTPRAVALDPLRARTRPSVDGELIAGNILDAISGDPIEAADIMVRDVEQRSIGRALSDEDGRFWVPVPGPGLYHLSVARIGYDPTATVNLAVMAGHNLFVEVRVAPVAIGLDPITATAPRVLPYLEASGFYDRARRGFGDFFGPSDLEKFPGSYPSHMLRRVPGLMKRGDRLWIRGAVNSQGRPCAPDIVLDWMMLRHASLDDIVTLSQIEAIEVYKGAATIPVQWRSYGGCGLIVVWTKH